ncbi:hypothetical protein A2U01_0034358, partial [Trifolium medium]|nr:hypothetical protein [Trifolium medium]
VETQKTGQFLLDINGSLDVILELLPKNTANEVVLDDYMVDIDDEVYGDDLQDPQQQQKLLEELEFTGELLADINESLDIISESIA